MEKEISRPVNKYENNHSLKILTVYNAIKNNPGIDYAELVARLNVEYNIKRIHSKEIIPDLMVTKKIYIDKTNGGFYIAGFKNE